METIEALLMLATVIERQIELDESIDIDPIDKLIRSNAKKEVLIEIYKFINKEKS